MDMAVVREKVGCKHDVSESYSPLLVVQMAEVLGMKCGVSLDLTVPASDGYVWDFNRKHCRDEAMEIVNDRKPLFLMLSPECTPDSNIQNLNKAKNNPAVVEAEIEKARVHRNWCCRLYQKQIDRGT